MPSTHQDSYFDLLIHWYLRQRPALQNLVVLVVGLLSTTTGAILSHTIRSLPYLLLHLPHRPSPLPPFPTPQLVHPVPDPHPAVPPLIPAVADPFIQRIAFAMPNQMLDWVDQRRVRHANAAFQQIWDDMVRELGARASCEGDVEAGQLLAELKEEGLVEEEEEMMWGTVRCAWARVMGEGRREPGEPVWGLCTDRELRRGTEDLVANLTEVATAAQTEQRRIRHLVAALASAEATDLIHTTLHPTLATCSTHPNPTTCIITALHTLQSHTRPGHAALPSWSLASPADHTGRGDVFTIRTPDTLYGVQIPSSLPTEPGEWGSRLSRRESSTA
ncbi:hypothetical protein Tdes44962_MAKER10427 [Teratosphaeria destructans]|uniref:Uncharacterized protein n=1 Tax=Teratosphaeria destructans TaxID=418781 RepID=A0A9W7SI63_9PEZI|nr:hypothetical protein Tdes44962_MAKER10427 [Teratosphaeria destructans]